MGRGLAVGYEMILDVMKFQEILFYEISIEVYFDPENAFPSLVLS